MSMVNNSGYGGNMQLPSNLLQQINQGLGVGSSSSLNHNFNQLFNNGRDTSNLIKSGKSSPFHATPKALAASMIGSQSNFFTKARGDKNN